MPSIKLTYFDIEGVAESIRLALILSGTDFEDDRVKFGQWAELKEKTPYGQLPILSIDGGPARTQSGAMLRWAGRLNPEKGLFPEDKLFDIEEAMGMVGDISRSWSPFLYMGMAPERMGHPAGFQTTPEGKGKIAELRKLWIKEQLPKYLGYISDMIDSHGGKWLVEGEKPTIADCLAVPTLRSFTKGHIDHVDPSCLSTNPKIVEYIQRFCALPEIKGRYQDGIGKDE